MGGAITMIRKSKVLVIAFLTMSTLCCGAYYAYAKWWLSFPPPSPKNGLSDFERVGYYRIDPETILVSLEHGERDVFADGGEMEFDKFLESGRAHPVAPLSDRPVSWRQSDYLKIADAVFRSVWKESFEDWNILSMIFDRACRDDPEGFDSGDIYFFKNTTANGKLLYTTREVLVSPQYGDISWGGGRNFPRPFFGWKSIDLKKLRITADDALRIAEESGGRSLRLAAGNKCDVSLILDIDAYGDWVAYYGGGVGVDFFAFYKIDPYTGKVRKVKSLWDLPR